MYTRKCFVKTMLEDQDDLSTDALTLHPRLLREGLGDKTQLNSSRLRGPLGTRIPEFAGVQVWAWAHVALGTSKDITGTVLAKMSARRVRKSKVETF